MSECNDSGSFGTSESCKHVMKILIASKDVFVGFYMFAVQ